MPMAQKSAPRENQINKAAEYKTYMHFVRAMNAPNNSKTSREYAWPEAAATLGQKNNLRKQEGLFTTPRHRVN